jgi:hypothetical protein
MNVTEKNVPNVFQLKAGLAKIDNHIVESRFRAGIKQGNAVVGLKRGRGNDPGVSKLSRIENVNLQSRNYFLLAATT